MAAGRSLGQIQEGLRNGVLVAALLGIVFMAPGAVMVAGLVTRRQNGHIAVAGPLVNLLSICHRSTTLGCGNRANWFSRIRPLFIPC